MYSVLIDNQIPLLYLKRAKIQAGNPGVPSLIAEDVIILK